MEPSVYGDIAVEMISEKEKEDWTLREFRLNVVWESGLYACIGSMHYIAVITSVQVRMLAF